MVIGWSQFFVCVGSVDSDIIWCLLGALKSFCWCCGGVTLQ